MTSVIIVSPRVLLREGIASLLQNTPYKVVAGITKPAELSHARYPTGQRMLAIVAADGDNRNLDEADDSIRLLRSSMPNTKVVLIVETKGPIDLRRVLALSPDTCVYNLGSRDNLIKVLELTFMDQQVFVLGESTATAPSKTNVTTVSDNDVTNPARGLSYSYRLGTNSQTALSPRERQILTSLAEGKSNKAIARLYNLSEATVKVHLKAILRKTKAHNRTQAAIWAIEHGLRS